MRCQMKGQLLFAYLATKVQSWIERCEAAKDEQKYQGELDIYEKPITSDIFHMNDLVCCIARVV